MKHTPKEIAELLKDKPHQPHYIEWLVKKAIEEEREECAILGAKTVEDMGRKAGGKIYADGQVIADAIRARSNAEIRGGEAVPLD